MRHDTALKALLGACAGIAVSWRLLAPVAVSGDQVVGSWTPGEGGFCCMTKDFACSEGVDEQGHSLGCGGLIIPGCDGGAPPGNNTGLCQFNGIPGWCTGNEKCANLVSGQCGG